MLLAQLIAVVLTAAKRFDAVVLHLEDSVRGMVGTMRFGRQTDLG